LGLHLPIGFSGIPKNVFKQGVSKSKGIIEYPIKIDAVT